MPDKSTDTERIAHLIDDLETVRTHPLRTIQSVGPLVLDALIALKAGDLAVVEEYLERVGHALATEDTWLRQRADVL